MTILSNFSGINNILPEARLKKTELVEALNVDVGLSNELRRRSGFARIDNKIYTGLWQAEDYLLAVCDGDLTRVHGAVLQHSLGGDRVWFCNLPDKRTVFSNGLINGVTDGAASTLLGVPLPENVGVATPVSGELTPGEYRWAVTHVRLSDGLEGGAEYSLPVSLPVGGLLLTALPVLAGHRSNIYLSNGEEFYLAGTTTGSSFGFLKKNTELFSPLLTAKIRPMPVGTVMTFWRGRLLVARGSILWASLPNNWEHCDIERDYKFFNAPITLLQPTADGIFVGTTNELAYLSGDRFDNLQYRQIIDKGVVLGSGVSVDARYLRAGGADNTSGQAMVCIAGGRIVFGYNGGDIFGVTDATYDVSAQEVAATWRLIDGIPQYIAVPV